MSNDMNTVGDVPAHIGAELRAAREQAAYTLEDVSKSLHIQSSYLAAIEKLDLDALPSLGYVLGFIRSYALHLGLDARDAVARYKADIQCPENLGMRDRPHHVPKRKIRVPRGSFAAGAVLSCLAVAVTWYGWQSDAQSAQYTEQKPVLTQNWGFEPIGPTTGNPDVVSLLATGPSWVQVTDEDGLVLLSRIMVPGELFETTRQNNPTISLRDAGAIELYIGGEKIGPLGEQGETLKNQNLITTVQ